MQDAGSIRKKKDMSPNPSENSNLDTSYPDVVYADYAAVMKRRHSIRYGDTVYAVYAGRNEERNTVRLCCKSLFKLAYFEFDADDLRLHTGKTTFDYGDGVWVRVVHLLPGDKKRCLYEGVIVEPDFGKERSHFFRGFRKGDYITCPVAYTEGSDTAFALLAPALSVPVSGRELIDTLQKKDGKGEYLFRLALCKLRKDGEYKIQLQYVITRKPAFNAFAYSEELFSRLPENPSDVFVPYTIYRTFKNAEYTYLRRQIQTALGLPLDDFVHTTDLRLFFLEKYKEAYHSQKIRLRNVLNHFEGRFPLGIRDENGIPSLCGFQIRADHPSSLTITFCGCASIEEELDAYAYAFSWNLAFRDLRQLCGDHYSSNSWNVSLMEYVLRMNFAKALLDQDILQNEQGLLFATGLFDSMDHPIYCFLSTMNVIGMGNTVFYRYGFMASESYEDGMNILREKFQYLPRVPSFLTECTPESFIFRAKYGVQMDIEKLLRQNVERIPLDIIANAAEDLPTIHELVDVVAHESSLRRNELSAALCKNDTTGEVIRERLRAILERAIDTSVKACRDGIITPEPTCYTRKNCAAMQIPLSFTGEITGNEDVFLVLLRIEENVYRAVTLYSAARARRNAFLLRENMRSFSWDGTRYIRKENTEKTCCEDDKHYD